MTLTTGIVYTTSFENWEKSIPPLLDAAGLAEQIKSTGVETVLIKPNLVEALPPPITTPVGLVEQLIRYLQSDTDYRLIIGEGCGAMNYDTWHAFQKLGYMDLAAGLGVELLDLNEAEPVHLKKGYSRWPEMHLPKIALESFLLSVPVLKAHSLAGVTLTMKNMMGLVPPAHYREGNSWKKSSFHHHIQDAVADLNRYRTPDFTLLDATVGMARAHLWGPACDPPVNILAAGCDPVAIDAYGTALLQKHWEKIGHIRSPNVELGSAEHLHVVQV